MPLTAPTKTWQVDANHTISEATAMDVQAAWWLALKDALIGFASNPWAIEYSCDGSTAGTAGDGVDRWADQTDVVFATSAGTAHSWVVLSNAITGMEILIECLTNSVTAGKLIRLVVSPAAGFTGGSTTSSPSATDQRVILDGPTTLNTIGLGSATSNVALDIVQHVLHSEDGEVTLVAMCAANECTAFAYFGVPDSPVTGWTDPLVAAWYAGAQAVNPPNPVEITFPLVFKTISSLSVDGAGVPRCYGLNMPAAGAAGVELHLVCPAANTNDDADETHGTPETFGTSHVAATNDITSEHEAPRVGLYSATAGDRGTHGRLCDVRWAGDELSTGDTVPADGSRTHVVMGPFFLPWNGSVPVIA